MRGATGWLKKAHHSRKRAANLIASTTVRSRPSGPNRTHRARQGGGVGRSIRSPGSVMGEYDGKGLSPGRAMRLFPRGRRGGAARGRGCGRGLKPARENLILNRVFPNGERDAPRQIDNQVSAGSGRRPEHGAGQRQRLHRALPPARRAAAAGRRRERIAARARRRQCGGAQDRADQGDRPLAQGRRAGRRDLDLPRP